MRILIKPRPLFGSVTPPPSKSMAHRTLICAALAGGSSVISNLHFSDDVKATLKSLKCIGASWRRIDSKIIEVTGTAGRGADGTQLFECGSFSSAAKAAPRCASSSR